MYKFVHIMPQSSLLFNGGIIEMMNRLEFVFEEHLFVVASKEIKDKFINQENVVLDCELVLKGFKGINAYSQLGQNLILHSMTIKPSQIIFLSNKVLSKITWVVWGHDLYSISNVSGKGIMYLLRKVIRIIALKKLSTIKAVGAGYKYDFLEVSRILNTSVKFLLMPYQSGVDLETNDFDVKSKNDSCLRILIGHSGYQFIKHVEILKKLVAYKEKGIEVYLPLSYGDSKYIGEVEEVAKKMFGNQAIVIKEYMNPTEYLNFLKKMDIAIFDYNHQAALGNISLLLYLEKKLYLSRGGVLARGLLLEDIEFYYTDELSSSYDSFKRPVKSARKAKHFTEEAFLSETERVQKWKRALEEITYE